MKGLLLCAAQTFGLEIVTNGNGTIVAQALNYWQTLSSNGGGVAVGAIVEVRSFPLQLTNPGREYSVPRSMCCTVCELAQPSWQSEEMWRFITSV